MRNEFLFQFALTTSRASFISTTNMSDAKAAAAARRAKILAGGSNRLSQAKGDLLEIAGNDSSAPSTPTAVSGSDLVSSTPESEKSTTPYRPLAARKARVASSAPATPVGDVSSSENPSDGSNTFNTENQSAVIYDHATGSDQEKEVGSNKTESVQNSEPTDEKVKNDRAEQQQEKTQTENHTVESEKTEKPASSIKQVEQEIAKIAGDTAEEIDGESTAKKAARPLAERRNRIKSGASAMSKTESVLSASTKVLNENDAVVKAALAKAGFVPLQQATVMKFVRLVAIVVVAAVVGYQSSTSSASIIKSSPMFADASSPAPLLELDRAVQGIAGAGRHLAGSADLEDAKNRIMALFERQAFPSIIGSSSAVAANAILTSADLGIAINSSILETSVFAVLAVWVFSGMFSQYISTKFVQKDKEKPNIVSQILSFLTTGVEGT